MTTTDPQTTPKNRNPAPAVRLAEAAWRRHCAICDRTLTPTDIVGLTETGWACDQCCQLP